MNWIQSPERQSSTDCALRRLDEGSLFRQLDAMTDVAKYEALYHELGALLAEVPYLGVDYRRPMTSEGLKWLARASVIVHQAIPQSGDTRAFDTASDWLAQGVQTHAHSGKIMMILHRVMARLEGALPSQSKGAFISAGEELHAFSALAKLLGEASTDALIIDPYMDAITLLDFAGLVPEGVPVRMLSDEGTVKPALEPAGRKWIGEHGLTRPLAIRLAPARSLHDRLIFINQRTAYIITQSLKDIAKRAHASIQRVDQELAAMKLSAFAETWNNSKVLVETT